ncbi:type IV pilus biogenesis protein PilM [Herminiimonas arsenitoxidans]|uniref:agglutinin biogenesis protein MshI n=1 Tax=Herminiimonas arsenitoxidans TaxID=1809410 RepID=UPI000970BA5A|nr:agglutinin biogenesis protein MshI [Herminiimonas arsenitoxidans]
MNWFGKKRKITDWMVVCIQPDGISVSHIKRSPSTKPLVEFAAFFALAGSTIPLVLEKLGKELRAERFHCINLMAANEYQLLSVEAPNVPADELKTAIRWRLKDMLDFHIDDATIDVLDVPLDKNAGNRSHLMYAVAARNQLIEQRQTLFSDAKMSLRIIDIPEMAQRNIAALLETEGRGLALLSFNAEGGLLTVTYAGELYLSRRIDVTSEQLMQEDDEQKQSCYERVTLELQRSLDHFERQYHFITLSKMMLAPLAEKASGLVPYLAENLYIPIETLNLEAILDFRSASELRALEMQQRYFMVLGAALRHETVAL